MEKRNDKNITQISEEDIKKFKNNLKNLRSKNQKNAFSFGNYEARIKALEESVAYILTKINEQEANS